MADQSSMDEGKIDTQLKVLQTYSEGKMKRYGLLFSVNGGAFALAKFGPEKTAAIPPAVIGFGAILFTVIMTLDIWMFGTAMRQQFGHVQEGLFGQHGRIVLLSLGLLLITASGLAADFQGSDWAGTAGILVLGAVWLIKAHRDIVRRFAGHEVPPAKSAASAHRK